MQTILGGAIGGLVAFVLSIPAIIQEVTERGKHKNLALVVDVKKVLGRKLSHHEIFSLSILFHILNGFLFGYFYVYLAEFGIFTFTSHPYQAVTLVFYSLVVWLIVGAVVFPALKMGFFGKKEGDLVWLEMLISQLLIALGFWLLMKYYQPFFFA